MGLVVWGLAVTQHSHHIWERGTRSVVLVGVEKDAESFKVVRKAKDRARRGALFGKPERKSVSMQMA